MRVVVDTNVLISGIFFKGPPHEILEAWITETLDLVVTTDILEEYRRGYIPEFHRAVIGGRCRSIRTMGWKYVHYANGDRELYDVASDPWEHANLAGDSRHAATEEDLRTRLLEWCMAAVDPVGSTDETSGLRPA